MVRMSITDLGSTADQRLIDKQIAGVIEAIMTQRYSLANRGLIPSERQLGDFISSLDEVSILDQIRRHPGAAATRAMLADDAQLLRWARLVGQSKAG